MSTNGSLCQPLRGSLARRWLIAGGLMLQFLASPVWAQQCPPTLMGTPDPCQLPDSTTAQVPLTSEYDALNIRALAAGATYLDPTTRVRIYKLTSATFPTASPWGWGHAYAEGGDEVSLPYNGNTRAIHLNNGSGEHWLVDFTP